MELEPLKEIKKISGNGGKRVVRYRATCAKFSSCEAAVAYINEHISMQNIITLQRLSGWWYLVYWRKEYLGKFEPPPQDIPIIENKEVEPVPVLRYKLPADLGEDVIYPEEEAAQGEEDEAEVQESDSAKPNEGMA